MKVYDLSLKLKCDVRDILNQLESEKYGSISRDTILNPEQLKIVTDKIKKMKTHRDSSTHSSNPSVYRSPGSLASAAPRMPATVSHGKRPVSIVIRKKPSAIAMKQTAHHHPLQEQHQESPEKSEKIEALEKSEKIENKKDHHDSVKTSIEQVVVHPNSSTQDKKYSTSHRHASSAHRSANASHARPATVRSISTQTSVPSKNNAGTSLSQSKTDTKNATHAPVKAHTRDYQDEAKKNKKSSKPKKPDTDYFDKYGIKGLDRLDNDQTVRRSKKSKFSSQDSTRSTSSESVLQQGFSRPIAPVVREVLLPASITVGELAQRMSMKASDVIKRMMGLGVFATINQSLDQETAELIVQEFGHKAKIIQENEIEINLKDSIIQMNQKHRPPVVTIMGHVDHGKTSLLDYIRRTKITQDEAGGITQHIGAYHVKTTKGGITFLDTPGHAAFAAMRARGAKATDIVILVVAADDGVKPQTIEAIQHAKSAHVPIIVAINKIDKTQGQFEPVRQELAAQGILSEEWGGDHLFVPISAKTGQGIDALLDAIALQAEMMELTASEEGPAVCVVVESRLDKGLGAVATVLVQSGTLRKGDVIVSGLSYGKIRSMTNESQVSVQSATPSMPIEITGMNGAFIAGDEAIVVPNERKAKEITMFRQSGVKQNKFQTISKASLTRDAGNTKVFRIIIKSDVQGSGEAIANALQSLNSTHAAVQIVAQSIGSIALSDVHLAIASQASIIGFNVRAESSIRKVAQQEGVEIQYYSVIYHLIEEIKQRMQGMVELEKKEKIIGTAQVKAVFRSSQFGVVAGCLVTDGLMTKQSMVRVLRNNIVIFSGKIDSLRRIRDDVSEVRSGTECGVGMKNCPDIQAGDQLEAFEITQVVQDIFKHLQS